MTNDVHTLSVSEKGLGEVPLVDGEEAQVATAMGGATGVEDVLERRGRAESGGNEGDGRQDRRESRRKRSGPSKKDGSTEGRRIGPLFENASSLAVLPAPAWSGTSPRGAHACCRTYRGVASGIVSGSVRSFGRIRKIGRTNRSSASRTAGGRWYSSEEHGTRGSTEWRWGSCSPSVGERQRQTRR